MSDCKHENLACLACGEQIEPEITVGIVSQEGVIQNTYTDGAGVEIITVANQLLDEHWREIEQVGIGHEGRCLTPSENLDVQENANGFISVWDDGIENAFHVQGMQEHRRQRLHGTWTTDSSRPSCTCADGHAEKWCKHKEAANNFLAIKENH